MNVFNPIKESLGVDSDVGWGVTSLRIHWRQSRRTSNLSKGLFDVTYSKITTFYIYQCIISQNNKLLSRSQIPYWIIRSLITGFFLKDKKSRDSGKKEGVIYVYIDWWWVPWQVSLRNIFLVGVSIETRKILLT